MRLSVLLFALAVLASAQTTRRPVVFVRGWDTNWILTGSCVPQTDPAATFGSLPALVQSDGARVYLFDNCAQAGQQNLPIESLGPLLGRFLNAIPEPQVDIVAHCMGGLIVRAYLSGMRQSAAFSPPANTKIGKIVFIATPQFGAGPGNFFGNDTQSQEIAMGSIFLWSLARWNQGFDDLRAIDSLAIIGNGGAIGNSDGVVSLTSASLSSFSRPDERTRVLPYCHDGGLALGSCAFGAQSAIAASPEAAAIVRSFLAGTNDWGQIGSPPSATPALNQFGGVFFAAKDANDNYFSTNSVTYDSAGDTLTSGTGVFYRDFLTAGLYAFGAQTTAGPVQGNVNIPSGKFVASVVKYVPVISGIFPSAGAPDALAAAPGSLISLYGFGLASGTAHAETLPLPTQLADATVAVGSEAAALLYAGDSQVNAYLPPDANGLVNVTIKNTKGQHTMTLLVSAAVPALFSIDGSGAGPAAAEHASGAVISESKPAAAHEYISLYATGLGATSKSKGLDVAKIKPQILVGGIQAKVTFAGRAPGFVGLDQINMQIPSGAKGAAVPVVVTSNGRTSNTVTLAIQ